MRLAAAFVLLLGCLPAGAQDGPKPPPPLMVWAAQPIPETPYTGPNRPIWKLKDILAAHKGQQSWTLAVALTRDFEGDYISLAPGEKTKTMLYADDRVFWSVQRGQMKVSITGQPPFTAAKGFLVDVAPHLPYSIENTGTEPVVFFRVTPAGEIPMYPLSETPTPVKGWKFVKAKAAVTLGPNLTEHRSPMGIITTTITSLISILTRTSSWPMPRAVISCPTAIPRPISSEPSPVPPRPIAISAISMKTWSSCGSSWKARSM